MKEKLIKFAAVFAVGAILFAISFLPVGKAVWWLRVGGILLCIFAIATLFVPDPTPPPVNKQYEYGVKSELMTKPERELYYALLAAVGSEMHVFPQIALAAFIDKKNFGSYRNELFRIVDFLLCDARTTRPLLVIELNDASHNRADRRARDEKVKCILERAGIGILTLNTEEFIDEKALKRKIKYSMLR